MVSERRRTASSFWVDVDKYYAMLYGGRPPVGRRIKMWLLNADFHVVASFRFSQWSRSLYDRHRLAGVVPLVVASLWRRRVSIIHHVYIDRRAKIGPGLLVMHRGGIYIGPVVLGENAVLHHNVTIGMRVAANDIRVPQLGDNVWIGPGATITGAIRVGDNVAISAGAVLSKSVPGNSLVAGNPARIVRSDYDTSDLINYKVPQSDAMPAAEVSTDTAVG